MTRDDTLLKLTFHCVDEAAPGDGFVDHSRRHWPRYRRWYFDKKRPTRPDAAYCRQQFAMFMPRLLPMLDRLSCAMADDPERCIQFLSLFQPPGFLAGCSQAVWRREGPVLLRNYDYYPGRFETTIMRSYWLQPVLCLSDCLWGALDGINAAGLAVSLAFGGSPRVGSGFGIPIILRYILECCHSVDEALVILAGIPSHMSYNLTLADPSGHAVSVFARTDDQPLRLSHHALATNHQFPIVWRAYVAATASVDRELFLINRLKDPNETLATMSRHFLGHPLYHRNYQQGFGTLYTAAYNCARKTLSLSWPKLTREFSLDGEMERSFPVKLHALPRKVAPPSAVYGTAERGLN